MDKWITPVSDTYKRLESIESKIDVLAMSVNSQDKRLEIVESKRKKAK